MNTLGSTEAGAMVQDTFLDSRGLESVRSMGRKDNPAALREMARQFESLFVQQMMKSMRAASDVFSEGNYMKSSESDFYQQMLDQQLSLELTKGRGLGLADAMYQQMLQSYGDHFDSPSAESTEQKKSIELPIQKADTASVQSTNSDEEGSAEKVSQFIDQIKPYAQWAASKLGVNPTALVAQAALETGWGQYVLKDPNGVSSNNLFNIKTTGGWQGDSIEVATSEFIDGVKEPVNAEFKQYRSLFESFSDYVELLKNPRYADAIKAGKDVEGFVRGLQQAGYATDPVYAEKILSIIDRNNLGSVFAGGNS
ncbi:flagellar assembly peptidoglycan hydrolase FlgJ [Gilvimarinus sp. SDUM040013]|uniref:Peptidoglycan hydrolase FlgJ n=1 Tax=Gilvimarinus gilvus TaxID=3058038 RepID=A0ABU4RUA5_9GAMM|nr:flagellar assembly peptidoglycan hydrolase FlgJ [Gilvimarinus sp. SDUM040013]MDO3385077.1 flagellar assembly peptidoglycan hydrolase FlgJ [Gilvimarinus sp. SDUM040013]MDX6848452.1 flagellar assembly peptidoglycan hydrolase FlgJ [Gilvimarinus sp. SDUM040013]